MSMSSLKLVALALAAVFAAFACAYGGSPAMTAARAPMAVAAGQAVHVPGEHNTEAYDRVDENPFLAARQNPLSTFSIDVDTASYSNVRRFLTQGQRPPADAVRIEELVNYFPYDYPAPRGTAPFSVGAELAACPWAPAHQLLRVAVQGRRIEEKRLPPRNLVFLLDVSGSMEDPRKLPLVRQAISLLVDRLTEQDRVAIVVYAGATGLALPPTSGDQKDRIRAVLARLQAGGSTNGGDGLRLAYKVARSQLQPGGINRVILATDGDFNVGTTSQGELLRLIERERESGINLSVLGFGMGNLKDSTMEKLADRGNGNYAYIDTLTEARKVLVNQGGGTLITIAKDVKIQVEFNPRHVKAYRLIGYENRLLRAEDFNDDKKDAGDLGAGHSVTALYELVPPSAPMALPGVDPLRYQTPAASQPERRPGGAVGQSGRDEDGLAGELLTLKLRYKEPDGQTSKLITTTVAAGAAPRASGELRFAAAVAAFGMLLRASPHRGVATYDLVRQLAEGALGPDRFGYRKEFLGLLELARKHAPLKEAAVLVH